ncbi:MAG: hypothetical protein EA390_07515 [Balneolaceae bacterium]|nr:MAG: hypothetical protein EA390_07515 [Balneolaceae bacterium]
MNSHIIPFEIPNVNHGFVHVKGLIHFKTDHLVLEFDERDGFVGVIKSDMKEKKIPYEEIDSINYIKKLFRTRIEIVGKSMRSLHDIPGAEQGRCVLVISRKNRKKAENAVSNARVLLSEYNLNKMDDDL